MFSKSLGTFCFLCVAEIKSWLQKQRTLVMRAAQRATSRFTWRSQESMQPSSRGSKPFCLGSSKGALFHFEFSLSGVTQSDGHRQEWFALVFSGAARPVSVSLWLNVLLKLTSKTLCREQRHHNVSKCRHSVPTLWIAFFFPYANLKCMTTYWSFLC